MRWTVLYWIVFCLLSAHVALSQDLFDDIQDLNIKNQSDSAMTLINLHQDRFEGLEQWYSLARLYIARG